MAEIDPHIVAQEALGERFSLTRILKFLCANQLGRRKIGTQPSTAAIVAEEVSQMDMKILLEIPEHDFLRHDWSELLRQRGIVVDALSATEKLETDILYKTIIIRGGDTIRLTRDDFSDFRRMLEAIGRQRDGTPEEIQRCSTTCLRSVLQQGVRRALKKLGLVRSEDLVSLSAPGTSLEVRTVAEELWSILPQMPRFRYILAQTLGAEDLMAPQEGLGPEHWKISTWPNS